MNIALLDENIKDDKALGQSLFAEAAALYMDDSDTISELFSAKEAEEIEMLKREALRRKPRIYSIADERYDMAAEPLPEMPQRRK